MKKRNCMKLAALGVTATMIASMTACGAQPDSAANAPAETSAPAEVAVSAEAEAPVNMTSVVVGADTELTGSVNGLDDELCSWTTGGTEAGTLAGDDYSFTPAIYVNDGAFDAEKSVVNDCASVTDTETAGLDLTIEKEAVNGIMVNNSEYTIKDSKITVATPEADGSLTCDFSGLGTAIAVYGQSDLTIENTEIEADGVANLAVFTDNGAKALLDNVNLHSDGGSLYEGYINSPNQGTMVAPPWILGIMGTSRGTNLEGDDSTMTVIDSETSASNWAVLSTDSGSNMYLNVVNTTMSLTGSEDPIQADGLYDNGNPYTDINGYGTYIIGSAVETFLGTEMNVGTYASIFTGGTGYYGNLKAGESYDLKAADGSTHTTYEATEDKDTVINSDTFGFMAHQGENECTIDGATVNSKFTSFLSKTGQNSIINIINGAKINAENGILLQALDNDDSTTEFNPNDEKVGMAFGTTHLENAGFPTEAVDTSEEAMAAAGGMGMGGPAPEGEGAPEGEEPADAAPAGEAPADAAPEGEAPADAAPEGEGGGDMMMQQDNGPTSTVYNVVDTALVGSIYNGTGWNANDLSQGKIRQMTMEVNLSGASTLEGAIASTSAIHTTYEGQTYLKENGITAFTDEAEAAAFAKDYQATSFDINEYYNIGQVANLLKYNGINDIAVTVADDAVWTVTDASLINSLVISGNGQVVVADGVTLTVDGKTYEAGTYTAADFK